MTRERRGEPADHVDRGGRRDVERGEHRLDRGQRRAAREGRQRPQAALVVREQEVVAPADGGPERPPRSGLRLAGSCRTAKRSSRRRAISAIDSVRAALGAQVGCRFTAQIGSMRVHEEIDALESMAISPIEYVVATRVLATMLAILPLYLVGLVGSYVATELSVTLLFDQPAGTFSHYFETFVRMGDIVLSVVKILVFSFAIAMIHTWYGFVVTGGPEAVGEATGRAIRASIVTIVLLDMVMTLLFWGGSSGVRISG